MESRLAFIIKIADWSFAKMPLYKSDETLWIGVKISLFKTLNIKIKKKNESSKRK